MTFNLADLFEMVCDAVPDREAVVSDVRRLTYRTLDERANRLAHHLTDSGISKGDHVGLQLLNGTEYVEGMLACFKIRAVPINVNYRYVEDELRYLFEDADLRALIVHRQFADRILKIEPSVELLEHVVFVEDESDLDVGEGWREYESALSKQSPARDFEPRSGEDIYCAYTGGTTGMPKGVLWRQEDIFFAGIGGGDPLHSGNVVEQPEGLLERIYDVGLCALPTPPFMHVSAHWLVFSMLLGAGKIVIAPGGRFEPPTIWRLVGDERVNVLVIVGDAMARPLVEELEARASEYDTSALMVIGSGGAVLSTSTKDRLTAILANTFIVDGFGSSETGTMGQSPSSAAAGKAHALRFPPSPYITVFDDQMKTVQSGSGVVGRVARSGHIPLGYYKDAKKTADTFIEVDGVRWVLPGDLAIVDDDGTIVLRGRGSVSINSGGEKVFPEEVEAALKEHSDVVDVVVVGVPDERWGERVVAVVQARDARAPMLSDIQGFLRARLAGYKIPRDLVLVEKVERQPSAKPDYRWARERAIEALSGGRS